MEFYFLLSVYYIALQWIVAGANILATHTFS